MNKNQRSQVNMRNQIIALINATSLAIIAKMPLFPVWYALFNDIMIAFNTYLDEQTAHREGLQADKIAIRFNLSAFALELASILQSYGTATDNLPLQLSMTYTKSQLDRLSITVLLSECRLISAATTANLAALIDYSVIAATIVDFDALIDSMVAADPKPEQGVYAKKLATAEIQTAMKESKVYIVKMDGVVRTIKRTELAFTKAYFFARKINKIPATTLAIKGHIKNLAGVPMPFVKITCATLNLDRKATAKGGFTVKNGEPGIHLITYFFPGYETVTQEVTIWTGLRAEVNVTMQPH